MNATRRLSLVLAAVVLLGAAAVVFHGRAECKAHHDEYDSYLLGSSASVFPVASLNRYLDAKFDPTLSYSSDMLATEAQVTDLLTHDKVKNIVLSVDLSNAISYNIDAEGIGNLDAYLQAYPVFANYPKAHIEMNEQAVTGTLESLARIRDLCREKGVNFLVLTPPVYYEYLRYFDWEQVVDFYTRLAEVTDYWDFLYSSVSFEPRYFYDETHARNCVGQMALARLFGDDSIYVPADLGEHVTRENAAEHWAALSQTHAQAAEAYTANVPVLMYHHLDQTGNDTTLITPEHFEAQIAALAAAGYTAVLPDELEAYVREGKPLPQRPILITFDDGYLSNYTLAFPILQKYRMKATIFVIGATMGNTEHYKDTNYPITPHFSVRQAREMAATGLISIQSHTYDMHQCKAFEGTDAARESILPLDGEREADYRAALTEDCRQMRRLLEESIGEPNAHVLAYPGGYYNPLAQVTLLENGFDMTFTTEMVSNTLLKGLPQSLLDLGRYNMNQAVSVEQLLAWVSSARG